MLLKVATRLAMSLAIVFLAFSGFLGVARAQAHQDEHHAGRSTSG